MRARGDGFLSHVLNFATVAFAVFLACGVAKADLIAVDWSGNFYRIDPATGDLFSIGTGNASGENSLSRNAAGAFFSTDFYNELLRIDPATGDVLHTGVTVNGLGDYRVIIGSAFQPGTDTFFIVGENSISIDGFLYDTIFTVDLATGLATPVGSPFPQAVTDLAFSPAGVLYAWTGELQTVNTSTGAVTAVNPGNFSGGLIEGLAFDPATGVLYGAGSQLYSIDTGTGSTTPIGGHYGDIRGIQFTAPVTIPEPGTPFLLGIPLSALLFCVARKKHVWR